MIFTATRPGCRASKRKGKGEKHTKLSRITTKEIYVVKQRSTEFLLFLLKNFYFFLYHLPLPTLLILRHLRIVFYFIGTPLIQRNTKFMLLPIN